MPVPTVIRNSTADSQIAQERIKGPAPVLVPNYSREEIAWLGAMQMRLERSRNQRDTTHDEMDGLTFVESWQAEEKLANTYIEPKLNDNDVNFQSGIVRDSIISVLQNLVNMDMGPSIHAYDVNQLEVTSMGQAIETIIEKTYELEKDDEKKVRRANELLKHGYYFVEELWEERWHWSKKWINKFDGSILSAKWTKKFKLLYARPVHNLLSGLLVYLGDITSYGMDYQPYVFTVKYRSYEDAKAEYGRIDENGKDVWERWKYVTKTRQDYATNLGPQIIYNTWRLTEVINYQVEEIHYQDPWTNEYAIMLNGVLMTPIGMPLPWGYDGYNIVMQNLEPIHEYWAYGASLIKRMRANTAIYDEMVKMAVLKTQRSFAPPYINISGRTISKRVFTPGKISVGIKSGDLQPVHPHEIEGVTSSEFAMITKMEEYIKSKVSPPTPQGGTGKNNQAMMMAQQQAARMAVGWFMFFITFGEQKLAWNRLFNILANWFEPTGTKIVQRPDDQDVSKMKDYLQKTYRVTSERTNLPGKGAGMRMVIPTDQNPTPDDVQSTQDELSKSQNMPVEVIVIKPEILKEAQMTWEIDIIPRERKVSDAGKVMFRGMLQDIQMFGQDVKMSYLEEKFAMMYDEDPSKLFNMNPQPMPNPNDPNAGGSGQGAAGSSQGGKPGVASSVKIPGMPTPAKNVAASIGNQIK